MRATMPGGSGRVLLLLRLPPPIGGGELLAESLVNRITHFDNVAISAWRSRIGTRAYQGQLRWSTSVSALGRMMASLRAIREQRPAVVYLSLPKTFPAFYWVVPVVVAARRRQIRICGELAGMRFDFLGHPYQRWIGLHMLRQLTSIRFLGHRIEAAHRHLRLPHPVVIYNGVDILPGAPRDVGWARRRPLTVVFVGALESSKGIETLLEVAVMVRRRGWPIQWLVAGEWVSQDVRARCGARIVQERLEHYFQWRGVTRGTDLHALYDSGHVLMLPTRLDGQPLVILESMARGLAVLSRPIGAISETILEGRNGRLIEALDPDAWADVLGEWLSCPEQLLAISQNNQVDFLARFTIERYVQRLLEWLRAAARDQLPQFVSDQPPDIEHEEAKTQSGTVVALKSRPPAATEANASDVKGRRSGPLLLLLRLPPPYGGGEMRAEMLARWFGANPAFELFEMRTRWGARALQGRFELRTVGAAALRSLRALRMTYCSRPAVVFLSLPKSCAPFLWTVPVIWCAARRGSLVCAELAGMRFEFRKNRSAWKLAQLVMRRLYSLRFLSHSIRKDHLSLPVRFPVVIYNGIEAPPPMGRRRTAVLRALYVGALERSKGIDVTLEAVEEAAKRGLPVEWHFVGECVDRPFIEARLAHVQQECPAARMKVSGLLIGNAKWDAYRDADVLVHPSRLDGQPLAILEAMSQGLAVIVSRVGAIPETVYEGRNGHLMSSWSGTEIVQTLAHWLDHRDELESIRQRNIEDYRERFTAHRYCGRIGEWLLAAARRELNDFQDDEPPWDQTIDERSRVMSRTDDRT